MTDVYYIKLITLNDDTKQLNAPGYNLPIHVYTDIYVNVSHCWRPHHSFTTNLHSQQTPFNTIDNS